MKERGKVVEISNGNNLSDSSFDLPCKKHPHSSSVGICAYCLKDRLMKLVCSDCGEQRLSSCSCSDVSSYRNSCSAMEVGSVGRISFLIESERFDDHPESRSHSKPRRQVKDRSDDVIMLKRSSSSCVEVKKSSGFWKIGKLFRKTRGKQSDEKTEIWVGVSRSRSLCSFRDTTAFNDPDQESSEFTSSTAKVSDVNEAEPSRSGFVKRALLDAKNGLNSKELKCGGGSLHPEQCGFPLEESDFSDMDGSEFIDLNLDLSRSSKTEYRERFGILKEDRLFSQGGVSCRITVNEKRVKKGSKGQKVWRWIVSQQHQHGWRSSL